MPSTIVIVVAIIVIAPLILFLFIYMSAFALIASAKSTPPKILPPLNDNQDITPPSPFVVVNKARGLALDIRNYTKSADVNLYPKDGSKAQTFTKPLMKAGPIGVSELNMCLKGSSDGYVISAPCDPNDDEQDFIYDTTKRIRSVKYQKCFDFYRLDDNTGTTVNSGNYKIHLDKCSDVDRQQWDFESN